MAEFRLETERLVLREWREADVEPFWRFSQDGEVLRYLGPAQDRQSIAEVIARQREIQKAEGFCLWAAEGMADSRLVGYCGLLPAKPPIDGEVEIGWRFARDVWGLGYAREAAQACLDWAWQFTDLPSIAAITVPANKRSWGLMQRIGMKYVEGGDFDHPDLAEGDPLRRHVLYRIDRPG